MLGGFLKRCLIATLSSFCSLPGLIESRSWPKPARCSLRLSCRRLVVGLTCQSNHIKGRLAEVFDDVHSEGSAFFGNGCHPVLAKLTTSLVSRLSRHLRCRPQLPSPQILMSIHVFVLGRMQDSGDRNWFIDSVTSAKRTITLLCHIRVMSIRIMSHMCWLSDHSFVIFSYRRERE